MPETVIAPPEASDDSAASRSDTDRDNERRLWAVAVFALALAAIVGSGAAVVGSVALAGLGVLVVFAIVFLRPAAGAYLYLAVTPLVVGLGRGALVPVLRPNEALLALIVAAIGLRVVVRFARGDRLSFSFSGIDRSLLILAVTGSLLPVLWRFGQGYAITSDDLSYAAVLWKFLMLYSVFRVAVTTPRQARVALWIAMGATAIVALIAILQSLSLFGVPEFLTRYYLPFQGNTADVGRGSSTFALSFAVADVMAMNLGIAVALLPQTDGRTRKILIGLGVVFLLGAIGAGQISGYIGLVVAAVAIGVATNQMRLVIRTGVPVAILGSLLLWPVLAGRFAGFTGGGLPQSWEGRMSNLRDFILPELQSGLGWLVGVRPAARMPAPERWREWVYIESGVVWLLWTGGIVLVAAFVYFVATSSRDLRSIIDADLESSPAAVGAFTGLWVITVLMIFDPHLTMRGTADLFFPLLALAQVSAPPLLGLANVSAEGVSTE